MPAENCKPGTLLLCVVKWPETGRSDRLSHLNKAFVVAQIVGAMKIAHFHTPKWRKGHWQFLRKRESTGPEQHAVSTLVSLFCEIVSWCTSTGNISVKAVWFWPNVGAALVAAQLPGLNHPHGYGATSAFRVDNPTARDYIHCEFRRPVTPRLKSSYILETDL